MRAGTLRHQVTIQERVITQDPTTGAAIETYMDEAQAESLGLDIEGAIDDWPVVEEQI